MKINNSEILEVQKYISLKVTFKKVTFYLLFNTVNSKVRGDYKSGMSTSYLTYYDTSDRVRKQHFKFFKEYIEKTFN